MTVDVATLNLEVDTTKLKQADRAQNQFGKSAEEMERRTRRATDSISDGFNQRICKFLFVRHDTQ